MTASSMTTPAVAYFHRAMRSLRASATIVLRERPPCLRTLSWNHRLSAHMGVPPSSLFQRGIADSLLFRSEVEPVA